MPSNNREPLSCAICPLIIIKFASDCTPMWYDFLFTYQDLSVFSLFWLHGRFSALLLSMQIRLLLLLLLIHLQSSAIRCFTEYNVFFIPQTVSPENAGPYLECFFELDGPSCKKYFSNNSYFIGARITVSISKENKIIGFKKIDLSFPLNPDTEHFLAVERIPISNGILDVEIEIMDLGDTMSTPQKMTDQLTVLNLDKGAFFSDIQWVSGFATTQ